MDPSSATYVGNFSVPRAGEGIGTLSFAGNRSELMLSTTFQLKMEELPETIIGTSIKGETITCLECIPRGQTNSFGADGRNYSLSRIFPHFVTIGETSTDPSAADVQRISFATEDLDTLVGNRLAFGWMFPKAEGLRSLIGDTKAPLTDSAQVAYFTGQTDIVDIKSELGLITIKNHVRGGMGNAKGVSIHNSVRIGMEFFEPVTLDVASDRVLVVLRFLTMLSGIHQTAHEFAAMKTTQDVHSPPYKIYMCMARPPADEAAPTSLRYDLPLDAAQRPEEFGTVMATWVARDPLRLAARVQHANCIEEGSSYTTNRIVAAANMFDLLPGEDYPAPPELSEYLKSAIAESRKVFKKVPASQERDSMLQALSRVGGSTLTFKVKHRGAIVSKHLNRFFPDLDKVLTLAVKCRNHFVHGPSGDLAASTIFPLIPFLTDALEFTFSVSELIECGWDAERWGLAPHTVSHSFTMFRSMYAERHAALVAAGLIKTA